MPSDTPSNPGKNGDRSKQRAASVRGIRKAERVTWRQRLDAVLVNAPLGWGILIALGFFVLAGSLGVWAHEQPMVAVDRVMDETKVVRLGFDEVDPSATEQARQQARERTPDIFEADMAFLNELRSSLATLPRTVSAAASPEDVEESIRQRFGINAERLEALKREMAEEAPRSEYVERVGRFVDRLMRKPMLDAATWQRTDQGLSRQIELRYGPGEPTTLAARTSPVNIDDQPALHSAVLDAAQRAGFDEPVLGVLISRLTATPLATFRADEAATSLAQAQAAQAVEPVIVRWAERSVIFARGDVLTPAQLALYKAELRAFDRQAASWRIGLRRLSVAGAIGAVVLGIAAYIGMFCPKLRQRPKHVAWIAAMMGLALTITVLSLAARPVSLPLAATTPVMLCAAVLAIAYNRRAGLALGSLLALLVCVILGLPVGVLAMLLAGVGVVVWRIDDLRQRNALVRLGLWTSAVLAISMFGVAVIERPIVPRVLGEVLADSGLAAISGVLVGAITLFILPLIERVFGVTTGMTLVELRDPRHPLLRELLQRAPGTYNHSLNVASIAETAAGAIGADSLLTYVGALYHDVGKMNKPEYFIENQAGGMNKHANLNPAMSVLVIIGHVKDGLEIARASTLPHVLHHFIEAHHGTTLVEFFYRRAIDQAEERSANDPNSAPDAKPIAKVVPEEIEYRYPGPKPRTRECAILMLSDAVESATRTLREPTPSRIDQLVRSLANKRLLDGQFDQCDLTNRDLNLVIESISRSVAAVYHGRVQYPSDKSAPKPPPKPPQKPMVKGIA